MDTADNHSINWVTNFVLFIIVAGAFVWSKTFLADYTAHTVVTLIIFYLLAHFKFRSRLGEHSIYVDVYIALAVVFLLIFASGGLASPVFFLIYFLLFGAALLVSAQSTYVIAVVASVLLLTSLAGDPMRELLQIVSLFLIAPLASLFGKQYLQTQKDKQKIAFLQEDANLAKEELQESTSKNAAKSKMVSDYTLQLIKKPLTAIWEDIDEMKNFKTLPKTVHTKLDEISSELQKILTGADKITEETKSE